MITGEEMLEELIKIEPSRLDENTQKLFYTIMKVIDERDELQEKIDKALKYMDNTFNISSVKDMFDAMNKIEEILKGESNE